VITLHIADANGEYMEIVLPSTCDSFVAATPAAMVNISFEQANWKPVTSKTDKEMFAKMTKAFPELAEYKKGDLMMQGGNLPVIITPANVELNDNFTFALQSVKGEVSEAKVSSPVKGMPEASLDWLGGMTTRSAKAEDAFWTLKVEPAKNKKGDKYVGISSYNRHSLVIENEKGTVVKTPFAYYLSIIDNADVTISTPLTNVDYADAIDVLTPNADGDAVFAIAHGLNGYYLLEATDILEVEQYGITIEGSKLMIANMPANKTSIEVDLKLTAVGLNGSVEEATTTLTIGQAIAATGTLADKTVTLGYDKANNSYLKAVRWNIADLGFTATQLNQFLGTKAAPTTKTLYITYENEDGEMVPAAPASEAIYAYDKNGVASATNGSVDYSNAVTFGFNLNSQTYEPKEYAVRLEVKAGSSVIYVAEAALTVENPTLGEGDVKLVPGFVDENGVYQITGNYTRSAVAVTYPLAEALILNDKVASIEDFIDVDNAQYIEDEREDEAFEKYLLVAPDPNHELKVHKMVYQWEVPAADWKPGYYNQLYKTRNVRAMLKLFGNPDNVVPFDFQVEVKSEVYTETPADAITFDATKLVNVFGQEDDDDTDADESVIDIKAAITKAVLQAGTDKGKTYNLFASSKKEGNDDAVTAVYNYSISTTAALTQAKLVVTTSGDEVSTLFSHNGEYLLDSNGLPIEIDKEDLIKFGVSAADYVAITTGQKFYLTVNESTQNSLTIKGLWDMYKIWAKYYLTDGTRGNELEIDATHKDYVDMYNEYVVNGDIKITPTTAAKDETSSTVAVKCDDRVASVTVKFNDPAVAAIYFQDLANNANKKIFSEANGVVFSDVTREDYSAITIKPVTEAPNSVTGGQVKVGMTLTIRDAWGMIMNVPFEVTVKTSAN